MTAFRGTFKRYSYRIHLLLWCFKTFLGTHYRFDLNLPEEQNLDIDHEAPSYLSDGPRKRTYEQVQPSSFNSAASSTFSSHAQAGQASSDFIDPFTAQREVNKKRLKDQALDAADSSMVASEISQMSTGIVGHQGYQQAARRRASGHPVEVTLLKFSDCFDNEIHSKEFDCVVGGSPSIDKHPTVPEGDIRSRKGARDAMNRLVSLYSFLVASIYQLHSEYLNQLSITTFDYKVQQEKILDWLSKKVLDPNDGLPSLRVAYSQPDLNWGSDDTYQMNNQPMKAILIKYFSQSQRRKNPLLKTAAAYLLKTYLDQHPSESI
ncbi:uncharacterized protein PGTG_16769 [Puccinia graminis f. sp. tritici CRL 75-36-700-3]|uniref:Uncharacterized protein n=1 Tax=Puccinia graminis f. sp. tritici (strain CRL 75-36-700-3 / race SCCL) TaxID=418459 RepID=E3L2F6_PUCGT|nr:uncharacterized protein PGTG_16769 [Puccinia graminis f. sp. tritici CRL 75-36-700-3]EFP90743.2 hypothetical protein PGTG_16769 [Puccinia graminis f. sp. tritici CRL 75-36-700-3]